MKYKSVLYWLFGFVLFVSWADLVWGQTTLTKEETINLENQFRQFEFKVDSLSTQDSLKTLMITELNEELKLTNEQLELTKKKAKLVKPSWYENKWLYFGYGSVLTYSILALVEQAGHAINIF